MLLKTAYKPQLCAIETINENMLSNGSSFNSVFDSLYMWERGYGKVVHYTAEGDLIHRGAKSSERILTLPHVQLFYAHFPHLFSHPATRSQDQNPHNANKTTFESMADNCYFCHSVFHLYCIAESIHIHTA